MPLTAKTLKFMVIRKIAVVFVCLSISIFGFGQGQLIDKVVAVVGEEVILYSDIQNQVLQAMADGIEVTPELEAYILEEMLFTKLLLHQADVDSITVPADQVEAELDNRINYFCQLLGSCEALEEYYGMSIELIKAEFREMVEDNMKAEQMEYSITGGTTVTPGEIEEFFNEIPKDSLPYINSQVEVGHIVVYPEVTQELKDEIYREMVQMREDLIAGRTSWCSKAFAISCDAGSASDCGKLGWQNKDVFVPEFASMALALDSGETSEPFWSDYGCHIMKLMDRRGNEVNVQHILICPEVGFEEKEAVRLNLEEVRSWIESDSLTFGEAAMKFSKDDMTKNNGGKIVNTQTGMSKLDMGTIDGVLGQVIDRLEPGEVSPAVGYTDPTNGTKGYRIVILYSRTEPHIANLEDDYQMFKNYALGTKKGEIMEEWLNKRIESTYIKIDEDYTHLDFQYNWFKKGTN